MSAPTFQVEIVNGNVSPLPPHVLPASGRGVLTVTEPADSAPLKPVEIVEGPDGYLILRGGGRITSEMVREIDNLPW